MSHFVKGPGSVTHNGVEYTEGQEIKDLSEGEAKALLQRGAVQTQPIENGKSNIVVPTEEEVAATVAASEVEVK